jgi:tetratricopeptide (TPR) repeat protein
MVKKIINKLVLLIAVLALGSTVANSQQTERLLDSANHYYSKGKYEESIRLYEKILDNGKESAGIYYNLGNAYYKTYDIANAILNYERAKLREPNNEDIQYNLELARKQVTDKIDAIPEFFLTKWFRQFVNLFSSDFWAILSMSAFILFLVLFSVYLYSAKLNLKKTAFWVGILAIIISAMSFAFSLQQKKDIVNSEQAIVFSSKVTVKSSPAQSGTELFVIHEGTKVSIEQKVGNWYEIKLSDGSKGWLKQTHIEII